MHYETTGERDLTEADFCFKRLARFSSGRRVVDIDGALVSRYVKARQGDGRANGTINLEIDVLSRMLKLAYENKKLLRLLVLHKLKESDRAKAFSNGGNLRRFADTCVSICKLP